MPGLLRGVARTAVVAGTATAVSNRVVAATEPIVGRNSAKRRPTNSSKAAYTAAAAAQPPNVRPLPGGGTGSDRAVRTKLAELKNQGILTDAEFQAQKAKILAS